MHYCCAYCGAVRAWVGSVTVYMISHTFHYYIQGTNMRALFQFKPSPFQQQILVKVGKHSRNAIHELWHNCVCVFCSCTRRHLQRSRAFYQKLALFRVTVEELCHLSIAQQKVCSLNAMWCECVCVCVCARAHFSVLFGEESIFQFLLP